MLSISAQTKGCGWGVKISMSKRGLTKPVTCAFAKTYREENHTPRDKCPVFQLFPIKDAFISLEDARDIYEMCQQVKNRQSRESIYIVNNMYMEGVETYIYTVQYFERCLRAPYRSPIVKKQPKK